jgi:Raf kinase inhibitor-like YbhB/YbcL family protein
MADAAERATLGPMKISSPAFANGDMIPEQFSQYGANQSPPLAFSGVPPDAHSLVLVIDDPDAPHGLVTHCIAFNIDPHSPGFAENHIPGDVVLGANQHGEAAYMGPKPPDREHRYFFHLYALDHQLNLPGGASRDEVEREMAGHVLAEAELMGRYAPPVAAR